MVKQRKCFEDYLSKDKNIPDRPWMADVYKFMIQRTSIQWQGYRQKASAMEMAIKWECFHFDANARAKLRKVKKDITIDESFADTSMIYTM